MQDQIMVGRGSVFSGAQVTVPAEMVDALRSAVFAEIGGATEAIDAVVISSDREAHPELFRAPAECLWECYGLLDELGWSRMVPPVPERVDLARGWALQRALTAAQEFADEDAAEILQRDAEAGWMGALWQLSDVVQARIDALAVQEAEEPAFDLAA
jgi:hypothetical protein